MPSSAPEKFPDITPSTQSITQDTAASFGGTSWRLMKFQGGDDLILAPDDKAKYTITSEPNGPAPRADRLQPWERYLEVVGTSSPRVRPACAHARHVPPGSLHERMVKHWPYVRSYIMEDGH